MAKGDYDWTDRTIARLAELWEEGHSGVEIGKRLGISKSAAIGKVHRLGLPPRPSPIRNGPTLSPVFLAEFRKAWESGTRVDTIKADFGISNVAVYGLVKQLGLTPRDAPHTKSDYHAGAAIPIQRIREIAGDKVARDPVKRCFWTTRIKGAYVCCDELTLVGSSWCPSHRPIAVRGAHGDVVAA